MRGLSIYSVLGKTFQRQQLQPSKCHHEVCFVFQPCLGLGEETGNKCILLFILISAFFRPNPAINHSSFLNLFSDHLHIHFVHINRSFICKIGGNYVDGTIIIILFLLISLFSRNNCFFHLASCIQSRIKNISASSILVLYL